MLLTRAYDETGNLRPIYRLTEGDIIEWKRNGERGFRRARVSAFALMAGHPRPIQIEPMTQEGRLSGGRRRWIGRNAVMRIYDCSGNRKPSRPEDQGE